MTTVTSSPTVVDRLVLETLAKGDIITVTCGVGSTYIYRFEVVDPGKLPTCVMMQTDPTGKEIGPSTVVLEGTGSWTTKQQNPVQDNWFGQQYTIGFGMLHVGGTLSVLDREGESGRWELLPACTKISHKTS